MIDIDKITEVLDSDEGTSLLAEYTRLFLQENHPELAHDENAQKTIMVLVIQQLSEQTIPAGIGYRDYIIKFLKASVDNFNESPSASGAPTTYSPTTNTRELKRSKPLIIAGVITILSSGLLTLIGGPTLGSIALVVGIGMSVSGLKKKDRL